MAWAYGVHPPALANGRSTTKRRKNWKANEGPSCLVHYHSSRITRHGFCHRSPMEYLTSVVFIPKTLAEIGHESGSVSGAQAHPVVLIDHTLWEIGFIASKPQFLVVSRKRALPWGMVAFPQKRGEGRSGKRPATRSFFAEPKGLVKAPLAAHAGGAHKPIRPFLYTTVRRQRPIKELKRRTKVEELEKPVYLTLVQGTERLLERRLRGFAETMPKVNI